MDAAEQAYEAALREIDRVVADGKDELILSGDEFHPLEEIPPEISDLTWLEELRLNHTQITDLTHLSNLTGLRSLHLSHTHVQDLAPLTDLTGLQFLYLDSSQIENLNPLSALTELQVLFLNKSKITDLAPLAGLQKLLSLVLNDTQVADLRPIAALSKLGTQEVIGHRGGAMVMSRILDFENTVATRLDARLAELASIQDEKDRARQTLAYLRSLPPWPEPYTPAATPDGSPPKPIGGDTLVEQAKALSEKTPLAEELVQDPDTGIFSVRHKIIEKPDLLSATLGQVADAIEDVLHDPSNGLNDGSLEIRKLRRTLDRYANDPQRVEMDFTTIHQSLTRQVTNEDLPPSEAILGLMGTLQDAAQGIRATDPAVAVNRKILQEQKLREMPAEALDTLRDGKPVLTALVEGETQEQMDEDVSGLVEGLQTIRPHLGGVTRDDAIMPGRDEAVRVFGRAARMVIMLRKSPEMIRKLHQSTGFKAAEIMAVLGTLVVLGRSIF